MPIHTVIEAKEKSKKKTIFEKVGGILYNSWPIPARFVIENLERRVNSQETELATVKGLLKISLGYVPACSHLGDRISEALKVKGG